MEMKDKTPKKRTLTTQMVLTIRTIVGAYVVYLAYQIMTNDEPKSWIIYAAVVVFVLAGGFFVVHSLYLLITGQYIGGKADTDEGSSKEEGVDTKDQEGSEAFDTGHDTESDPDKDTEDAVEIEKVEADVVSEGLSYITTASASDKTIEDAKTEEV